MKYPRFGFGEPRIGFRSSWLKFELLFRCLVCAVVRIRLLKTGKSTGYGPRKPPLCSQDIVEDSHGVELTKTRDFVVVVKITSKWRMREARQPRLFLWMVQIIITPGYLSRKMRISEPEQTSCYLRLSTFDIISIWRPILSVLFVPFALRLKI